MKIMINVLMETRVRKNMLTFEMEHIKALNLTNSLWNVCSQSTQTLCSIFLPLLRRYQGIKARCWLMGLPGNVQ